MESHMLPLENYLSDPCGSLSIPYYKAKVILPPPGLQIVHQRELADGVPAGWLDTPYFRLFHDLKHIHAPSTPPSYCLRTAETADCAAIAALLSQCYPGMQATAESVSAWRQERVFRPELWVLAESENGVLAGAALGTYDEEAQEGTLEWVQIYPDHRGHGLGTSVVLELLGRLSGMANFATVSGEINNPTCPERLYRRCGFTGNDVWHILRKTNK